MSSSDLLTNRMNKATRRSHAISDKLIKAKLALSLNSEEVWSEGLVVFYEIFKFLENAMIEKKDENLGKLLIDGLARTEAFEEDLAHFLGGNWKVSYEIREPVARYLAHMQQLLDTDPDMLIPYVYHLYMGLMSGGQLLKNKRDVEGIFIFQFEIQPGEAVTSFDEHRISDLKAHLKSVINAIGETMDEEKKMKLVNEGRNVFELNDSLIRSISSPDRVLAERAVLFAFGVAAVVIVYFFLSY